MFNDIRAVTELLGSHLVRGSGRIASSPCTGTAEGLVEDLSRREKEIFSLIGSGAVRPNQLDEVRTALQAVRLLKKFRYGGDPHKRRKAALDGFTQQNSEMLLTPDCSVLRRALLSRMKRILERALPPPVDNRFNLSVLRRRPDWLTKVCVDDFFSQRVPLMPEEAIEWVPSAEMPWNPRFGSGAVEEGASFPFLKRWEFVDGRSPLLEAIRSGDIHRILREVPLMGRCRACAVLKEMFKDRLITIEPVDGTFLQHGVRRVFYTSIHQGPLRWTAMDVMNLEDAQVINQRYALTGSRDSTIATIDLKDASNLVRWVDVLEVFPAWTVPYLAACRSTHCEIEDNVVELGMFAGMGNATTFVVETLMFWAAAVAARSVNGLSCDICSVYGDDVVIDNASVPLVLEAYKALGWVVSEEKSFWGSNPFRESCGMWAFNGHRVTPTRFDGYDLRTPEGRSGYRASIASLLDSGLGLNLILADRLMKTAGHQVPVSTYDIPGSTVVFDKYGMWRNNHSRINTRINRDTQVFEAKVEVTSAQELEVPTDRIGYLFGSLAGQMRTSVKRNRAGQVKSHVLRIPIPHRNRTKSRWIECTPLWGDTSRTNLKVRCTKDGTIVC